MKINTNKKIIKKCVVLTTLVCLLATCATALQGCSKTAEAKSGNMINIAAENCRSPFVILVDTYAEQDIAADAALLAEMAQRKYGADIPVLTSDKLTGGNKYILAFGSYDLPESSSLMFEMKKNEYALRVSEKNGGITVLAAFSGGLARKALMDKLLNTFNNGGIVMPENTDIKEKVNADDLIITTNVSLRDPCVLVAKDGTYYMYGTGWVYYKNTTEKLSGEWEGPFQCVNEKPADSDKQYWAPEVHFYNGSYYMFTTYHKAATDHRGCVILKSDSPEGPFEMWSNGHVTPEDWDCIDGTLYVDGSGQPWMVMVHEWTCMSDNVGRMAIAKMSPDLKKLTTEPVDIFKATDAKWATGTITDGPWLYTTEGGDLLMIWSNFDEAGYAVGIARSSNGRIDGQWTQLDSALYSKKITGGYDGGHGMFFRDKDGQLYLSIHSPNEKTGDRKTLAVMVPMKEEANMITWDFD